MDYLKSPKLIPGKSVIGLIAPSGVVEKEGLEKGMKILASWGFSVKLGAHIMARSQDYSAGTPVDPLAGDNEELILALEEVGESKSAIGRWLERLAAHNQADRIRGIILGRFTKIGEKDYPVWGREISVEQVFTKVFGKRHFPIACLPEFGHVEEEKRKCFLRSSPNPVG